MSYDHDILTLNVYMMLMIGLSDRLEEGGQQSLYELLFMLKILYLLL